MTQPAKRVPKWVKLDVAILVVGAMLVIATPLWFEPNRDGVVHRVARNAQTMGHLVWHYMTEYKKPAVPKLTAPL